MTARWGTFQIFLAIILVLVGRPGPSMRVKMVMRTHYLILYSI